MKNSSNLNTILLWATLAGLGFIATITYNNAIALSEMRGANVSRSELELKLTEVRNEQARLMVELQQLKLDVVRVQREVNRQ
jgi:hypothetical protein